LENSATITAATNKKLKFKCTTKKNPVHRGYSRRNQFRFLIKCLPDEDIRRCLSRWFF
jgi:hypothetical protein